MFDLTMNWLTILGSILLVTVPLSSLAVVLNNRSRERSINMTYMDRRRRETRVLVEVIRLRQRMVALCAIHAKARSDSAKERLHRPAGTHTEDPVITLHGIEYASPEAINQ